MNAARLRARWAALTGTGGAASIALALLVLGCVFVSVASPRVSLEYRTRALQSSLAGTTPLVRSVLASIGYTDFTVAYQGQIPASALVDARGQLRANLARIGLPLQPASADWSSLTTAYGVVGGAARSAFNGSTPPQLEVSYRDVLGGNARLVAGAYPGPAAGHRLNIAVTVATARRFGLHVGSRLTTANKIRLTVSGIIRPADPGSAFWTADPNAAAPGPPIPRGPQYWSGAAFVSATELGQLQSDFNLYNGQLVWDFPLAIDGVNADQAVGLQNELNEASFRAGAVETVAGPVSIAVGSGLSSQLFAFVTTDAALAVLLSLLFVSLTVLGLVVVLLGARMVAENRRAEFGLMRARGAARPQLALLALAGGAAAAVPAALAGLAAAVAVTPGYPEPLAWWLAAVTLLAALAGPPLIAVRWADTGEAAGVRTLDLQPARPAGARRWVTEGALVLLAVGGLIELHQQGLPSSGGVNFYISAAPVLVAIPAAVLVIRLSPLVLRGLLRTAAARPGVAAFVGFARAARGSLAAMLPAFALVLALTVVAFGFMVRTAVLRGQDGASWQTTGADAVISMVTTAPLTPAGQHAIAAVPGARHTAAALVTAGTPGSGPPVTVVLVSPAGYAALVAGTPFPRVPAALLAEPAGGAAPGTPAPALASPAAAAELAHRAVALSTDLGTLRVRVARLSSTPAVPGTGSFVVLPFWAASHLPAPKSPTELLVTGPRLDDQALTATAARVVPGATIAFRARVLASLSGAALPHGAYVAFAEGSGVAAGFCVLVLILSLVLAARSRALTLARLSTMGLGTDQGRLLVIAEALPQVLAAAVAGAACALALVPLLGPVLDLSVFTGSAAAVPVRADLVALAIPAAGLIILAVATLSAQAIAASRRGAASALRISG